MNSELNIWAQERITSGTGEDPSEEQFIAKFKSIKNNSKQHTFQIFPLENGFPFQSKTSLSSINSF